jgi:TatA/E family protein of Tat protein translocase
MPRGQELLILLIVVAVLFGAKRLPDSARSLGRSLRIFKSEMKEMKDDEKKDDDTSNK